MTYQDVTYSWHKRFNLFLPDIWLGHCIPHYMVTPLKFFTNINLFRSFYSRFPYGFQKAFSFSVLAVSLHIPSFTLLSHSTLFLILLFTSGLMCIWTHRLWPLAGECTCSSQLWVYHSEGGIDQSISPLTYWQLLPPGKRKINYLQWSSTRVYQPYSGPSPCVGIIGQHSPNPVFVRGRGESKQTQNLLLFVLVFLFCSLLLLLLRQIKYKVRWAGWWRR